MVPRAMERAMLEKLLEAFELHVRDAREKASLRLHVSTELLVELHGGSIRKLLERWRWQRRKETKIATERRQKCQILHKKNYREKEIKKNSSSFVNIFISLDFAT